MENQQDTAKQQKRQKFENPKWICMSYGTREMFSQWGTSAFGLYTIFFYETVIGIPNEFAIAAFLIFSLWNAINDPLIGYLVERFPMPWHKNKGFKRFPWTIMSAIPWMFSYFAIFMVPYQWDPVNDVWKIFAWYVISLIIFDTIFSIFDINTGSLFPEKFRGLEERRFTQGWATLFGILGLVLAFLLTGLFIPDNIEGLSRLDVMPYYRKSATLSLVGGIFLSFLFIPGAYENKKIRERNLKYLEKNPKPEPFFAVVKEVLSNRAFTIKILFFFGYQASVALINASALYVTTFILDDPDAMIFLLGAMLGGALLTVPLWVYIGNRVENNKIMGVVAGVTMFVSFLPMIFVNGLIPWVISLFLFGVGLGAQWWGNVPIMGDIIDDAHVRTGKLEPSVYYGYQTFFIRFGEGFKALAIAITHELTGFIEGSLTLASLQNNNPTGWELAVFGIRIHTAIIPAILVGLTTLLFWRLYPLTPERVAENRRILHQRDLDLLKP